MRLVIFDVDGTLVDSQDHIVEAQRRAFDAVGVPRPTRTRMLAVVGLSLVEAFAALVGPDGPILELRDAYRTAWTDMRHEGGFAEHLYPGAAEIVADLAATPGRQLGIATGKSRKGVDRLIAAQGWQGVFATIQTADDHPSKPDPSMILAALAETACRPAEAVMVGDTTFDMTMAVSAGVCALGVAWGYHPASALREGGATALADDFDGLRERLGLPTKVPV